MPTGDTVQVGLLADAPHLVDAVGEMRWREWGVPPEPVEREFWVEVTAREAGRERLPVTWVATDAEGVALGAVGLGVFDIEERQDTSPWVLGMIVRADLRGQGIGRLLLTELEQWAAARGDRQVWVATGGPAIGFYEACGWTVTEVVALRTGETSTVLTKRI